MITVGIQVNTAGTAAALRRVRKAFDPPLHQHVRHGINDAVDRYEEFIRRRFDRLSKYGGLGEWRPLAASTIKKKLGSGRGVTTTRAAQGRTTAARKGNKSIVQILVESGKLKESLFLTGPGHIRQSLPNGVRVGSADRTIRYHQHGTTRMPSRKVYVPPNPQLVQQMEKDVSYGVRKMLAQAIQQSAPKVA